MSTKKVVRRLRRAQGFTLVELLVALTIFAVLMTAVTAIFVGSLRTTQVGYQQMKAYEQARTALSVIEEDLVRGFSSQQTSDVHGFYGTPIGMTFIGVVKATSDAKDRNLARVTYVIYNQESGDPFPGALDDFDQTGAPVSRDAFQYALLRYVEPDVSDLETFPFNLDGRLPSESRTYRDVLNILCARVKGMQFDSSRSDLSKDEQDLVRAKTCEMWIRMLAGGDQEFPVNFWRDIKLTDVKNYIVTGNILSIAPQTDRYAAPFNGTTFFDYDYAREYLALKKDTDPTSDDWHSKGRQSLWWNDNLAWDWGDPRLPEVVAVNFWLMFESPYPGAPDFRRRFVLEVNLPVGYQRQPRVG